VDRRATAIARRPPPTEGELSQPADSIGGLDDKVMKRNEFRCRRRPTPDAPPRHPELRRANLLRAAATGATACFP
jgi:hypothetical protein